MSASLIELLGRLRAAPGAAVELTTVELLDWPAGHVAALKAGGVLMPGEPGVSAECSGCEEACVMPVSVVPREGQPPVLFIVCNQRDDISKVSVAPAALERWRVTLPGLADALARLLGCDAATPMGDRTFRLGMVKGRRDKAAVSLEWRDDGPHLKVAGHELELMLVLDIEDGGLVLDVRRLGRCADAPAGGAAGAREPPEERRKRLQDRVNREKAKGTRAFLQVVADEEGLHKSRLQQLLKPPKPHGATWMDPGLGGKDSLSAKKKTPR